MIASVSIYSELDAPVEMNRLPSIGRLRNSTQSHVKGKSSVWCCLDSIGIETMDKQPEIIRFRQRFMVNVVCILFSPLKVIVFLTPIDTCICVHILSIICSIDEK
jgi:hypothetical protein